jgi:hypothetical protein
VEICTSGKNVLTDKPKGASVEAAGVASRETQANTPLSTLAGREQQAQIPALAAE